MERSCSYCKDVPATSFCGQRCFSAFYCTQICADLDYKVHQYKCVGNVESLLNKELETRYEANQAGGVMFLMLGRYKGTPLVLLGLERGGAYRHQFNMFGGRHDKSRTRAETAQAEFTEEFGAAARIPPPNVDELMRAKKIFANLSIDHDGPAKTTIIILWDLGDRFPSRSEWNDRNRRMYKDRRVSRSFKEMEALQTFELRDLIDASKRVGPVVGSKSSVRPWRERGDPVQISSFTLQTIRDFESLGYFQNNKEER